MTRLRDAALPGALRTIVLACPGAGGVGLHVPGGAAGHRDGREARVASRDGRTGRGGTRRHPRRGLRPCREPGGRRLLARRAREVPLRASSRHLPDRGLRGRERDRLPARRRAGRTVRESDRHPPRRGREHERRGHSSWARHPGAHRDSAPSPGGGLSRREGVAGRAARSWNR